MIAANHYRSGQFSGLYHVIKCQAKTVALTQAYPAYPRRQTLELNTLFRHIKPVMQVWIIRDEFFDLFIRFVNVFRIAG